MARRGRNNRLRTTANSHGRHVAGLRRIQEGRISSSEDLQRMVKPMVRLFVENILSRGCLTTGPDLNTVEKLEAFITRGQNLEDKRFFQVLFAIHPESIGTNNSSVETAGGGSTCTALTWIVLNVDSECFGLKCF